jgi:hypothetical protein
MSRPSGSLPVRGPTFRSRIVDAVPGAGRARRARPTRKWAGRLSVYAARTDSELDRDRTYEPWGHRTTDEHAPVVCRLAHHYIKSPSPSFCSGGISPDAHASPCVALSRVPHSFSNSFSPFVRHSARLPSNARCASTPMSACTLRAWSSRRRSLPENSPNRSPKASACTPSPIVV